MHSSVTVTSKDDLKFSAVSNALYTSARVVICISKNSRSRFLRLVFLRCVSWPQNDASYIQQKCPNGQLPAVNRLVQLLALYTNPESHNAQRYRQTDS